MVETLRCRQADINNGSVKTIGTTIAKVSEISSAIAAAVEQQSPATQEIARNISEASTGTSEVSESITAVTQSIGESSEAAGHVLSASSELAQNGEMMRAEVAGFLDEVRKVV